MIDITSLCIHSDLETAQFSAQLFFPQLQRLTMSDISRGDGPDWHAGVLRAILVGVGPSFKALALRELEHSDRTLLEIDLVAQQLESLEISSPYGTLFILPEDYSSIAPASGNSSSVSTISPSFPNSLSTSQLPRSSTFASIFKSSQPFQSPPTAAKESIRFFRSPRSRTSRRSSLTATMDSMTRTMGGRI